MAAIIPEAAEGVTEGTSAVRGAASAGRHRGAPSRSERAARSDLAGRGKQHARRAGRDFGRARVPGGRNYQSVILAEFLLAVLVIALAPIAKGGTDTSKAKGSASPYDTNSLKQLLGVGLVYFILALASSGKSLGRFSAWFGGLVLVAIGIQNTVNGGFTALFHMFAPGVGSGLGTFPASDNPSLLPSLNINAGQFAPGALAQGVSANQVNPNNIAQGITSAFGVTGQPTDIFPTVEPGGQIVQTNTVSPPDGGTGTVTTV